MKKVGFSLLALLVFWLVLAVLGDRAARSVYYSGFMAAGTICFAVAFALLFTVPAGRRLSLLPALFWGFLVPTGVLIIFTLLATRLPDYYVWQTSYYENVAACLIPGVITPVAATVFLVASIVTLVVTRMAKK